jgi:hypothetical protein
VTRTAPAGTAPAGTAPAGTAPAAAVADRTALALLTPGCFAAGQARPALALLAQAGFHPVHAQLVSFDPDLITRMWADSLPGMQPPDRRIVVYDLLLAAESLLLVLVDPGAGPHAPAAERLAAAKGHSDPARTGPDAFRTRLGAANRVINLLHCAATTADAVRELALLLGPDDLATAWRRAAAAEVLDLAGPLLDARALWYGNSLTHVAVAVRSRLVLALAAEGGSDPGWQRRCAAEWAWVRDQPVTAPRAVARSYRQVFGPLDRPPVGLPDSPTARARLRALAALDELQSGREVPVEVLRAMLAAAGFVLERWEWVVLASSAVSPIPVGADG